ncbi:MAG: ATP-binding cassette domain-containing protein [Cohaesibacter sp.]|jgi:ATP-binding cassette subfamily C protein LapB|nr:ATP-binding cassette domain-containing protein [Cohaesibacter sp.]
MSDFKKTQANDNASGGGAKKKKASQPDKGIERSEGRHAELIAKLAKVAANEAPSALDANQFDPLNIELSDFHPDKGQHLFLTMQMLASQWSERAKSRKFEAADLSEQFPTPQLLEAEGKAQDSTITQREIALSAIHQDHCPAILALDNGLCVLVLAIAEDGSFVIERQHGIFERIDAVELARAYSGTLFEMQPLVGQGALAALNGELNGAENAAKASPYSSGQAPAKSGLLNWLIEQVWQTNKGLLVQLMVAAALSNLLMITLPIFIMSVYDRVIPHFAVETLWTLSIGVFIAMALDLGLRYVRLNLSDAIGLAASVKLQSRLYQRLTRMPLSQAPRTPGGLADALKEIEGLCLIGPGLIVAMLIDLPFVLVILGLIAYLGGAAVWGAIAGGVMIAIMVGYGFHASRTKGQQDAQLLHLKTNQMAETIEALEAVKATGAENRLLGAWERLTDNQAIASHHARLHNAFAMQATMAASQLAIVLTVMIGVYQIGGGLMTVGNLAASILLVGRVIAPISNIVSLFGRSLLLSSTLDRARNLLESQEEEAGDTARQPLGNKCAPIAFHNVSYAFDEAAQPCLEEISLTIAPGEKVGIIGRNGSGKSTLLRLIPRFLEPSSGTLLFDQFNLRQYDPAQLRRLMAYMPQDNVLFDRSLRDNICLGDLTISAKRLEEVGRVTGVNEFVASHPQGYGLMVGPRGERLSGGERQAVCLARTLATDAPIILLDEPTSAMDNSLEAHFVRTSNELLANKTLVLTTHRTHLLKMVDRVIWLDKGKVVADGPRDQVLSNLKKNA